MARYVAHIESSMPPLEAFDYVADLSRFAEWDPGVVESTQVEGSGPEPGAEYDVTVAFAGRRVTLRYVVEAIDRPRRIEVVGTTRLLKSIDVITVGAHDAGSYVTYDARLRLPLLLRGFDPMLSLAFRSIGDKAAAGLAKALQGRLSGSR